MADPLEGLADDGTIRTGASRDRIPAEFRAILAGSGAAIRRAAPDASVYVYGSVATGQACVPRSDVDVLAIGLDADTAAIVSTALSPEHRDLCRSVEIAAVARSVVEGDSDEAYGLRVFLHHYCVHLAGENLDRATTAFLGDRTALRGFNGDIARHLRRWRSDIDRADPAELGRRVARKTLLTVAGLVSAHDATWTTDRAHATRRWSEVHPVLATGLAQLLAWSSGTAVAVRPELHRQLDGVVGSISRQFGDDVGFWDSDAPD